MNYYEIDPSPIASAQYKFFAELEAQEGGRFDVDDYEFLQAQSLNRRCPRPSRPITGASNDHHLGLHPRL